MRIASIGELGLAAGATLPVPEVVSVSDVRAALMDDATSNDDQQSVSHLPTGDFLEFRAVEPDGQIFINREQQGINGYLDLPRANAKALGLPVTGGPDLADAEIQWNDFVLALGFDFDRSDGILGADFVGVAVHELGHVLGFSSGADEFDESSLPNGPLAPEDLREYAILNVPDLFRYSVESLPDRDVAVGGEPYFSIDGGQIPLGYFATGYYNGDGGQASHWQEGHGIMDGFVSTEIILQITPLDLQLMDVIGWDLAPVPEPETGNFLVVAFGILWQRFRKR